MSSRSLPDLPAAGSLALHLDLVGGLAGDMFVAALVDALPALESGRARRGGRGAAGRRGDAGVRGHDAGRPRRAALRHRHAVSPRARAPRHAPYRGAGRAHGRAPRSPPTCARTRSPSSRCSRTRKARCTASRPRRCTSTRSATGTRCWTSSRPARSPRGWPARAGARRRCRSAAGRCKTAHGLLPVPAPATSALLAGYRWHDDGIGGERVTPTGAAILRHLVPPEACGGMRGAGRLHAAGYGAGTRALAGVPNVVRALAMATTGEAPTTTGSRSSSSTSTT